MQNAWGVRTCSAPGVGYRDVDLGDNKGKIAEDIDAAVAKVLNGEFDVLVFPGDGLGSGVANLPAAAPVTHRFLEEQIESAKALLDERLPRAVRARRGGA